MDSVSDAESPGRSRGMLYLLSQFCSVYDDLADLADTICCGNDVFGLSSSQSLIPDQNEKRLGEAAGLSESIQAFLPGHRR